MRVSLPPFQALLDSHGSDVYRFLVACVGHSEADDCYQEACIAALRAYPRLRHGGNLRAWFLRIAQRKAIDAHRARGRRAVPVGGPPEPEGAAAPPASEAALDPEPELWGAVRSLPPKQRGAVFMRSVLGLPYEELASALDCSQEAARRSVHEGLAKLREEWSG
jgi:RNA polymerase sigma factor (sigma-70 family)